MIDKPSTPRKRDFVHGKLLIAMPNMRDERFDRAVILMIAHDANHAMGLIINKPLKNLSTSAVFEALDLAGDAMRDEPVFYGGPVETNRGFVVHGPSYASEETMTLADGCGITGALSALEALFSVDGQHAPARLCLGYAGWSAGQLESEIAANAWLHCDADHALILNTDHDALWQTTLETMGVNPAMFSTAWSETRDRNEPLN